MPNTTQKGRCVNCRSDIAITEAYSHGDMIKCGSCGTQHKVQRSGEGIRLVIADTGPLKEVLRSNQQLVSRLEADYRKARGSFGMGVNGLGVGVAYVVWQIGQKERLLETSLFWEAALTALFSGVILELANFFFLAKRQQMSKLSREIDAAKEEGRQLQQKLRDAMRG